ncbi:uncharacterized protein LOC133442349 isoform X2 [Cololabis saira]|uniref:uncharacterized protein LOC133442349 isoform X2 n=1 Tax=Cololabis saira TaxID=129043 RepID=UPI002AD379B1|nr:uncharacterized protein LOC133442349 isoform X2 [Cololabis saira]
MISIHLISLFLWVAQDFVSCTKTNPPADVLAVKLGGNITLNCTYECSSGFVHGSWNEESETSRSHGTLNNGSSCTIFLTLSDLGVDDVNKNYTCYTEDREDPELRRRTQRVVFLQFQVQRIIPNSTVGPNTKTKNGSHLVDQKDSSAGEFTGIKVLASVTVTVAMVLAALAVYLCVNRNRQNRNGETRQFRTRSPQPSYAAVLPVKGKLSTQSERVTLSIPPPGKMIPPKDDDSDTEVPYADIMITIRGVSTPELSQVSYLATGERWGDESKSHLQASRSADRLRVPHAREVSRKMSTSSEYAVITYA